MGGEAVPSKALTGRAAPRPGPAARRMRVLRAISRPWAIRGWHAAMIGIFLVLVLLPTLYVLGFVTAGLEPIREWASANPAQVAKVGPALALSFGVALVVAGIDLLFGLPLAWLIVRRKFRGKSWFNTLIDAPLAVTTAGLGFSVVLLWGITSKVSPLPPGALGLTSGPFAILIFLHLTTTFPYMVRALAAILEEIEIEYESAARTLGASRLTAARTITLPLFRSGMATGLILVIAKALSDTGGALTALTLINATTLNGSALLGTWRNDPTVPTEALALVSALMIGLALVLLVAVKYVALRLRFPLRRVWPVAERRLSRGSAPRLRDFGAIAFLAVFILIPAFFFLSYVFVVPPSTGLSWTVFGAAVATSFLVASAATVINLAVGIPMAVYITRGRFRLVGKILDALVNIPYIVPSVALGISLSLFWGAQRSIVPSDLVLVILAHVAFTFPFIVRNTVGALEQLDPAFEETARTLGAKPVQVFRRVVFPTIRAAIIGGSIMAFTRSVGETGATLAVSTTTVTAPILIVRLLTGTATQSPDYAAAAAAEIVLVSIAFAVILGLRLFVDWRRPRG